MTLSRASTALLLAAPLASLALAAPHEGDPKVLDRTAPYDGPGYRRTSPLAPPARGLAPSGGPNDSALGASFASDRVRLLSWLPLNQLDGAPSANDSWGYVSPSGSEYALVCTQENTVFVNVDDPLAPQVVAVKNGPDSLWRDVKVYDEYAYAVSEGGRGIQVFDLTEIDAGQVALVNTIDDVSDAATHNVAIDEATGRLYRAGGGQNGLRIYDIATDPAAPAFLGLWTTRYVHDVQVHTYTSGPMAGRTIAYACAGFAGGSVLTALDVLDVTDAANVGLISTVQYPNPAYSHQGWLSADLTKFYLGDELDEGGSTTTTTHVFDVSNPLTPTYTGEFTNGNASIGHNLYTQGDLLYEANYRSGLRVFDLSTDPLDPDEVAFFDTYPTDDGARFNGLWNVYPYLPSGIVFGSDIERGLFVWWVGDAPFDIELPTGAPAALAANGASVPVTITESQAGTLDPSSARLFYDIGSGFEEAALIALGGDNYEAAFPNLPCNGSVDWYVAAATTGGVPFASPADAPATFHTSSVDCGGGTSTYCQAGANSAGPGAAIATSGSVSIGANDLALEISGGPANKFGIFFYGPNQIQVPFGDGFRCIGAGGIGTFRLLPPILTSATGDVSRPLDYSASPASAGAGRIDPGSTWNFQFWYRDPMGPGGSGFNLSNGLTASFQP